MTSSSSLARNSIIFRATQGPSTVGSPSPERGSRGRYKELLDAVLDSMVTGREYQNPYDVRNKEDSRYPCPQKVDPLRLANPAGRRLETVLYEYERSLRCASPKRLSNSCRPSTPLSLAQTPNVLQTIVNLGAAAPRPPLALGLPPQIPAHSLRHRTFCTLAYV